MDSKLFLVLQGSEVGRACSLIFQGTTPGFFDFLFSVVFVFHQNTTLAARAGKFVTGDSTEMMPSEPAAARNDGRLSPGAPQPEPSGPCEQTRAPRRPGSCASFPL